jgi:hypothetical protein
MLANLGKNILKNLPSNYANHANNNATVLISLHSGSAYPSNIINQAITGQFFKHCHRRYG